MRPAPVAAESSIRSPVHEGLVLPGGLLRELAWEEGLADPRFEPWEAGFARNDATQGAYGPAERRVDNVTFDYIDYQRAGRTSVRDWLLIRTRIRGESTPR